MKHKKFLWILALSTSMLGLASCSGGTTTSSIDSVPNDEIYAVYEAYKANGGTQSYDEWLASIKGEKGDKGDKGDTGATGATGATGSKGDKGDKGDAGQNGTNGSSVLTGEGAPDANLGSNGDSYIDTATFDYYTKSDGAWSKIGNIKGATGAKGDKGDTGATGATGFKGGKGDKGDAGAAGKDAVTYIPCIFNNWDGTKLYEFYFEKGTSAVYDGVTPTKADTTVGIHTAHWTWTGWDKSLENITQPMIFTATFESLVNVTFKNYDGTVISTSTVNFGETPSYAGVAPTKPSEVDGSTTIEWTFNGWDKAFEPIYADTTYTAVFDSPNAIKCTFKNYDGTLLGYSYCAAGGKAVYKGETPTKADANNDGVITRYTFSGWDNAVTNIQKETTFTAKYDESTYYVCTFVDWDDTELKQVTVAQNGTANYGLTPRKDPVADGNNVTEYTFNSWDKPTSGITAPTTFKANYTSKTYAGYIVTFNDVGGDVIAKAPVATGATAVYPENPKDLVDKYYSYDSTNVTMFVGWDSSLENVTSAKTVTAKTKTISRHKNGEYPQTKVTDSAIITELDSLTSADVDTQGYYEYGGEKYAKEYNCWRKVEPIKWRYLRNTIDDVAEFMSEKVLTSHVWNGTSSDYNDGSHANNYAKSDIRKWLNGDFMDQVFHYDRSLVKEVTVDNSASTTGPFTNEYVCNNTTDYIYLPSYQDVKNESYGFYSHADRIAYDVDGDTTYWWTRSPSPNYSHGASGVDSDGYVNRDYNVLIFRGVRPSLQLSVA